MSDKHLLGKPHLIGKDGRAWWYEDVDGVYVVQKCIDSKGNFLRIHSALIKWRAIRNALARKDKL